MSAAGGRLWRVAAGLLAASLSVVLTLLLVEAGLRLLWPQSLLHDPDAFLEDPVLTGRLKPGFQDRFTGPEYSTTWTINEDGYRGPVAGARVAGTWRVAALGDSFTFGYGVEEEEAWPRVLEAALETAGGRKEEIYNLGIGGYGTTQQVAWLEERLKAGLQPDAVIVGFYPGNDLSDSLRGEAARQAAESGEGGAGSPAAGLPSPSRALRMKRWLGSRLHLYTLISDRADGLLVRFGLRSVVYPEEVEVLRESPAPEVARGWEAVGRALDRLRALSESHRFSAAVMAIPMRHQVVPESWDRVRDYYRRTTGEDLAAVRLDEPGRRLERLCRRAGLPLLDLSPFFRSADDPGAFYFQRDQHWTREGHAAAARALLFWLPHAWASPEKDPNTTP